MDSELINHPMGSHEFAALIQQTAGKTGEQAEEWLLRLPIEKLHGLKKCAAILLDLVDNAIEIRKRGSDLND